MNDDRLIDLEMKFAHHERAIDQLEKTVFDQHRLIEALEIQLKRLSDKFEGLNPPDVGSGDQKPPHY